MDQFRREGGLLRRKVVDGRDELRGEFRERHRVAVGKVLFNEITDIFALRDRPTGLDVVMRQARLPALVVPPASQERFSIATARIVSSSTFACFQSLEIITKEHDEEADGLEL